MGREMQIRVGWIHNGLTSVVEFYLFKSRKQFVTWLDSAAEKLVEQLHHELPLPLSYQSIVLIAATRPRIVRCKTPQRRENRRKQAKKNEQQAPL